MKRSKSLTSNTHNPILQAWLQSEIRFADYLGKTNFGWLTTIENNSEISNRVGLITKQYYRDLHLNNELYQSNNWLIDYKNNIINWNSKSIVEIGAGNCIFSKEIAESVDQVFAMDWALHPAEVLPENVIQINSDILSEEIPRVDGVCSADFLEHIPTHSLLNLLKKISIAGKRQLHVIACYDDNHSHLTLMPPAGWLSLFRSISRDYSMTAVSCRRDDVKQVTCVIER